MKILAVVNQKGGSGKSTFCAQAAHAGIEAGLRVLLVDLDPQGSLSTAFPSAEEVQGDVSTASALFAEGATIAPELVKPGLSIIRKDALLRRLTVDNRAGLKRPGAYLKGLHAEFDLVIIDTPGALGENVPTTTAALIAADAVVCPFAVGVFEAEPLGQLWQHLQEIVSGGLNPRLRVLGLLPSKVNTASREELSALDDLQAHPYVGKFVLPVVLSEKAAVKQSIARGRAVWRGVRGNGHRTAAAEWQAATSMVLKNLGVI